MPKSASPVNLFDYKDYRKFLHDWFIAAKSARGSFSYRAFSMRAGFSSPNFLKLVMEGQRNLTEESLPKFMQGLKLNKQEQDFFTNLVFFTQADTHEKKDFYYKKLLQSKKYSELKPLEKEQYNYYATWYNPVIRELIVSKDFDGTPEWLASKIFPAITPQQAAKSIEVLEKLGFIEKTASGRYKQASPLVTTGPESLSLVLLNYHKNLLELSQTIMPITPSDTRDVSSLTLGIAKGRMAQLKKKIQEFRQEVLKLVSNDTEPEEVVLLNMQLLPVTMEGAKQPFLAPADKAGTK
ncbi:TIGR02147 family protein [bacterium]|nr:TIGR02147 family protein [bacterium]